LSISNALKENAILDLTDVIASALSRRTSGRCAKQSRVEQIFFTEDEIAFLARIATVRAESAPVRDGRTGGANAPRNDIKGVEFLDK
jgi:hypothetical protein